jgi:hypothetical protein
MTIEYRMATKRRPGKYKAHDYSGEPYPFHLRRPDPRKIRVTEPGWGTDDEEPFGSEMIEYPSDMYEPRDSHLGSATIESLALIGAGVAALAVIVYFMTRKATETGEQVVESTIP